MMVIPPNPELIKLANRILDLNEKVLEINRLLALPLTNPTFSREVPEGWPRPSVKGGWRRCKNEFIDGGFCWPLRDDGQPLTLREYGATLCVHSRHHNENLVSKVLTHCALCGAAKSEDGNWVGGSLDYEIKIEELAHP